MNQFTPKYKTTLDKILCRHKVRKLIQETEFIVKAFPCDWKYQFFTTSFRI